MIDKKTASDLSSTAVVQAQAIQKYLTAIEVAIRTAIATGYFELEVGVEAATLSDTQSAAFEDEDALMKAVFNEAKQAGWPDLEYVVTEIPGEPVEEGEDPNPSTFVTTIKFEW